MEVYHDPECVAGRIEAIFVGTGGDKERFTFRSFLDFRLALLGVHDERGYRKRRMMIQRKTSS